jgi:3-dehydroquinate synthase
MVDASIGGKTGVDTVLGKNLVGAFHPPVAVVADLDTLATLTLQQRSNGLAEALKHGVIADAGYFHRVASTGVASTGVASTGVASANVAAADWHDIVSGSVAIKAAAVHADERENGRRKTLNFGHTVGHALEHLLNYTVPHGECIAIGMMAETRIAIVLGICDAALAPVLEDALHACGLPTQVPSSLTVDAIVDATGNDKKSRAGVVEYALPARLGAMAGADREYGIPVDRGTVLRALQRA